MSIKNELNDLRDEVITYVNVPSSPNSINTTFSPSGNGKNIYLVFKHKVYGYKAIKKGFSWPAFFFGIIWAGVKKMWGMLLVLFISMLILTIVLSIVAEGIGLRGEEVNILLIPANILYSVVCGYFGNRWYKNYLINRGYDQHGSIRANNVNSALSKINS